MKEHLIDSSGSIESGAEASARMGSILTRLTPEAQNSDALATLLGDGWSVEELLSVQA